EQEISRFCELMADVPIPGDEPQERLQHFFNALTQVLLHRDGFAKAVLRSVSSGVPGVSDKVISYQETMNRLIVSAIKGIPVNTVEQTENNADIFFMARMMQSIWYAELIGWMSDVVSEEDVVLRTVRGSFLLLRGLEATQDSSADAPHTVA